MRQLVLQWLAGLVLFCCFCSGTAAGFEVSARADDERPFSVTSMPTQLPRTHTDEEYTNGWMTIAVDWTSKRIHTGSRQTASDGNYFFSVWDLDMSWIRSVSIPRGNNNEALEAYRSTVSQERGEVLTVSEERGDEWPLVIRQDSTSGDILQTYDTTSRPGSCTQLNGGRFIAVDEQRDRVYVGMNQGGGNLMQVMLFSWEQGSAMTLDSCYESFNGTSLLPSRAVWAFDQRFLLVGGRSIGAATRPAVIVFDAELQQTVDTLGHHRFQHLLDGQGNGNTAICGGHDVLGDGAFFFLDTGANELVRVPELFRNPDGTWGGFAEPDAVSPRLEDHFSDGWSNSNVLSLHVHRGQVLLMAPDRLIHVDGRTMEPVRLLNLQNDATLNPSGSDVDITRASWHPETSLGYVSGQRTPFLFRVEMWNPPTTDADDDNLLLVLMIVGAVLVSGAIVGAVVVMRRRSGSDSVQAKKPLVAAGADGKRKASAKKKAGKASKPPAAAKASPPKKQSKRSSPAKGRGSSPDKRRPSLVKQGSSGELSATARARMKEADATAKGGSLASTSSSRSKPGAGSARRGSAAGAGAGGSAPVRRKSASGRRARSASAPKAGGGGATAAGSSSAAAALLSKSAKPTETPPVPDVKAEKEAEKAAAKAEKDADKAAAKAEKEAEKAAVKAEKEAEKAAVKAEKEAEKAVLAQAQRAIADATKQREERYRALMESLEAKDKELVPVLVASNVKLATKAVENGLSLPAPAAGTPGWFGTKQVRLVAPPAIVACCVWLQANALESEGIFRLAGTSSDVKALKDAMLKDPSKVPSFAKIMDEHVVASAVKSYFRESPTPVINPDWVSTISGVIEASTNKSSPERAEMLRPILVSLPPASFDALRVLFRTLRAVADKAAVNKMAEHQLATVWGPNLLRSAEGTSDMVGGYGLASLCIAEYRLLFHPVP